MTECPDCRAHTGLVACNNSLKLRVSAVEHTHEKDIIEVKDSLNTAFDRIDKRMPNWMMYPIIGIWICLFGLTFMTYRSVSVVREGLAVSKAIDAVKHESFSNDQYGKDPTR